MGKHQEDGITIADEDLVQVLPISTDSLLEGVQKDAEVSNPGTEVGIDLTGTTLTFESAGANKVGQVYKVIDAEAKIIQVRMYSIG
jgi:hypothetical protein